MTFFVDTDRDGQTRVNWDRKYIVFRKPRPYDGKSEFKFVQAKCDGHRVLIIKHPETSERFAITTSGHDVGPQLVNCEWYRQLHSRMNSLEWFDGEIFLQGDTAEHLKTALVEKRNDIRFAAFGHSHTPANASLRAVEEVANHYKLHVPRWEIYHPNNGLLDREVGPYQQALENVKLLGDHYDGVVFKNGMYSEWAKLKHKKTIDLIVMAINPGKGKYAGMCGALICGVQCEDGRVVVANVSGMGDEIRASISEADLDRVIEVEYERVASQGRLRHPRFMRWRDDKLSQHCTLDQDERLVKYHAQ